MGKDTAPHYTGHRKRLRQKFLKSPELFEDYELLELLLTYGLPRKDTKVLSKSLLKKFHNLRGVVFANGEELKEIEGISEGLVAFIKVIQEIITRIDVQELFEKKVVSSPRDVFQYFRNKMGYLEKECFFALMLNTKNKVISVEKVAEGTVNYLNLYPRELIEIIIKKRAVGIIFIHNHPGGDPTPSTEDRLITQKINKLLKEIDVVLLDHIVISRGGYFSFKENGLIN